MSKKYLDLSKKNIKDKQNLIDNITKFQYDELKKIKEFNDIDYEGFKDSKKELMQSFYNNNLIDFNNKIHKLLKKITDCPSVSDEWNTKNDIIDKNDIQQNDKIKSVCELIKQNKIEIEKNCFRAGKSSQKVYICDKYVYKSQAINICRRAEISECMKRHFEFFNLNQFVLKVDPFTMNYIQQTTMKNICKNNKKYTNIINKNKNEYNIDLDIELKNHIEHPIDNICIVSDKLDNNKNEKSVLMVYDRSSMDFQDYILECGDHNKYLDNIIYILKLMFCINDILYDICQFQHCDMKCMQILLKITYEGKVLSKDEVIKKINLDSNNITPILSDFDKSTLTINIDKNLNFIKIDNLKNMELITSKFNDKLFYKLFKFEKLICRVRLAQYVSNTKHNQNDIQFKKFKGGKKYTNRKKIKNNKHSRRKLKRRNTKIKNISRRRGGGLKKSVKKMLYNKYYSSSISEKIPYYQGNQVGLRVDDLPLISNEYFNACLLSSTLLLVGHKKPKNKSAIQTNKNTADNIRNNLINKITKSNHINKIYKLIDEDIIKKNNNYNSTGNSIAAESVNLNVDNNKYRMTNPITELKSNTEIILQMDE